MKKKFALSALAAASISVASLASAAEINLYGASAQFDFLNANAVAFVKQYCTTTLPAAAGDGYVITYKTGGLSNTVKNGVVTGTGCSGIPGSTDNFLTLTYTGFGSGEGITSTTKIASLDPEFTDGCNVAAGERRVAPAGTAANSTVATGSLAAYKAATVCKPINIGTSDVAWNNFDQFANDEIVAGFNTITPLPTFSAPPNAGVSTVAVPFAFYVNPAVTATHCVDNLTDKKKTGGLCTTAGVNGATNTNIEQCATGSVCETTPSTIDNISRSQANILFSGQILNWNQLGEYYTSNPVKLCIRKPGSGTHVAFDKTVMRAAGKAGWGAEYLTLANNDLANEMPYNYFNGSSTDMKNCLGGLDGAGVTFSGAIGYMDADTSNVAGAAGYTKVKYNGVPANRTSVRNGAYEFYTVGQMYPMNINTALESAVINYVKIPANIPASKVKFWATVNEMNFIRGLDVAYPAKGLAPSAPQKP